jgi:hypothetical protein
MQYRRTAVALPLVSLVFLSSCGSSEVPKNPQTPAVHVETKDHLIRPNRKEGSEFTKATDMYGPIIAFEGNSWVDLKISPWAYSWLPVSDDFLFRGTDSPLRKYDQYIAKVKGTPGKAAEYEQKNIYRVDAEPWAGRCHAWALASVMEPEIKINKSLVVDGITFTESDLKALMVVTYDNVSGLVQFGQRMNGDEKSVPDDIYPDQFHRVLQKELFERRRPFIMEKDLGMEVWNTPIFKAEVTTLKDPNDPYVLHVKASLVGAAPLDASPDADLPARRNVVYEYTYDLYGYPQADGSMKVIYGLWTGDSIRNHPDFLFGLPDEKVRKSWNPEVDVNVVDELVKKAKAQAAIQ